MPRKPSIPSKLHAAILKRWLSGASPNDIVEWIERTNTNRAEPVHTSRSSIQRLMEELGDSEDVRLQAIRRVRLKAGRTLDMLEDVNNAIQKCVTDADSADTPFDRERAGFKLRALATQHTALHRDLKLAAVLGAGADALLHRRENVHDMEMDDVRHQRELEEQGAAPESYERDYDAELNEPTVSAGQDPKVPDSISLESQPIVESKRAGEPPEIVGAMTAIEEQIALLMAATTGEVRRPAPTPRLPAPQPAKAFRRSSQRLEPVQPAA